jgi:hypothetical protein
VRDKIARLVMLALVVASVLTWMTLPARAAYEKHSNYDHLVHLRFKEKWLLPPVTLGNPFTADNMGYHQVLRPFTTIPWTDYRTGKRVTANPARSIMAADLSFQPAPFGTDVLVKRDQANALVQLGMLSHMGHFAVLNANDEWVRPMAVDIVNQLADVADHFKLGTLQGTYQRIAAEVADPKFQGGPSPTVTRYDDTVRALYDIVANTYGVDGHWYFMLGGDIAGMLALTSGGDRFHTQYFLSVTDDLYHFRPMLRADSMTRRILLYLHWERPRDTAFIASQTWNLTNHYLLGYDQWTAFGHETNPPTDIVDPETGSTLNEWDSYNGWGWPTEVPYERR